MQAGFVDCWLRSLIFGQFASGALNGIELSRVGTACQNRKSVSAETLFTKSLRPYGTLARCFRINIHE